MSDLTGKSFAEIFPKLLQDPGDGSIQKSDGTEGASGKANLTGGNTFSGENLFVNLVQPSLDLDSYNDLSIKPLVNFSRTSTKTYFDSNGVLQTASANTLPVSYEYDGSSWVKKGWLIEEERTNLITYSEDFTDSYWNKAPNAVLTSNEYEAPDGNQTADKYTISGSTSRAINTAGISISPSTDYTLSLFIKGISGVQDIQLYATFDNSGTQVGDTETAIGIWTRIDFTVTSGASDTSVSFGTSHLGSSTSDVIAIWGAQLEQGSFPSSYIPTSGSTVTRTADIADITDLSWYNQDEGTFVAELDVPYESEGRAFDINDGTDDNRILVNAYENQFLIETNNSIEANISESNSTGEKKVAVSYKENDLAFVKNGTIVGTDSSATIPTVTTLDIGSVRGSFFSNMILKSLKYYPKRLSNAQLQSLTS